jgi:hypothetical protein
MFDAMVDRAFTKAGTGPKETEPSVASGAKGSGEQSPSINASPGLAKTAFAGAAHRGS